MGEHSTRHPRKLAHHKARANPKATLYELEAEAMKALAHPKRLLILDLLSDGKERNVTDLVDETGISQSNISQNLAVMRSAGLLLTRRDGNLIYYRVTDARVLRAVGLMRAAMTEMAENRQVVMERAAERHKQRVRRATLGAYAVFGLLGFVALFAVAHPLLVGGDLPQVAQHAQFMLNSGSFSGLLESCSSVSPQAPTGVVSNAMSAMA